MALAELIDVFSRDADAQVRAIAAAGASDAARIEAETSRARTERVASAVARSLAAVRQTADTDLAVALHRARADVLLARDAMLARIRATTEAALAARAAEPRVATALVAAAIAGAGDAEGTLRCAPALADLARAAAPAGLRVIADAAIATGAIVELASGTRVDATLRMLLAREWPRLACEALALERNR